MTIPSIRRLYEKNRTDAPLLDLVESLQLRDRDEDNNRLLSATDINLTGSRDLEGTEFSLELGNVVFEVNERLSDAGLRLVGSGSGCVGRTEDLVLDRHDEFS